MKYSLRKFILHSEYNLNQRIEHAKPYAIVLGWIGVVAHPLWYVYWVYLFSDSSVVYESFWLRLVGFFSMLALAFINKLPKFLMTYSSLLYVAIVTYNFPFFEMFYVLKKGSKDPSLLAYEMTLIATILILALLTDVILFIVCLTLGLGMGIILYITTTTNPIYPPHTFELFDVGIYALLFGIIFTYNNTLYRRKVNQAMRLTCGKIFHEIKTPLLSIILGVQSVIHQLKNKNNSQIKNDGIQNVVHELNLINKSSLAIKHLIELFSYNIQKDQGQTFLNQKEKQECASIVNLVKLAVQHYPFSMIKDRKLVHIDTTTDFEITIVPLLFQNMIFNLLNNAIREIHKVKRGEIYISFGKEKKCTLLYFKDSANNINQYELELIFKTGFSRRSEGLGLGLAFCAEVMQSINGKIACSKESQHTVFTLYFPIDT